MRKVKKVVKKKQEDKENEEVIKYQLYIYFVSSRDRNSRDLSLLNVAPEEQLDGRTNATIGNDQIEDFFNANEKYLKPLKKAI